MGGGVDIHVIVQEWWIFDAKKGCIMFCISCPSLIVFRIVAKFSFHAKFSVTNRKVTHDRVILAESLKAMTISESLKWKAIEYVNNYP